MLTAIFRRCSNLFGGHRSPAKRGVHVAHPRLGVPFYFIANQSVLLALVALVLLMASGPAFAQTDYDTDNDNLIDINNLAQLNAIRWDLNGDGAIDASASTADTTTYNTAFSNAMSGMGCPATCTGYELMSNLDFDENSDNAITAADTTYWNSGAGWDPIARDPSGERFETTLKGNGHTIDNLFINRTSNNQGLFAAVENGARIESLGITNASVTASEYVGILTANNYGEIVACYTTGAISASNFAGGLAGFHHSDAGAAATITTSYSTASVTSGSNAANVGGLVGRASQPSGATTTIINSYSTGAVSSGGGGLIGSNNLGTTTASYWDTSTSGRATSVLGTGYATADLQAPTDYTGIYTAWNANIDGQAGNDDPWAFGTAYQYPVLKYASMDTAVQFAAQPVRYDTDSDGLIEVSSLAQLNAMRWDLNGDGAIDTSATTSDTTAYNTAFPRRDSRSGSRMGCPSACTGYELMNNLDFDENSDNEITSADATYWNSGTGWDPIARDPAGQQFETTLKGNGHTIDNLFINRTSNNQGLFAAVGNGGRIEALGVTNASVTASEYVGILSGNNYGEIVACYTTGSITGTNFIGGLAGLQSGRTGAPATITTSYSTASVTSNAANVGGLVGRTFQAAGSSSTIINSYSTGAVSSTGGGLIGSNNSGTATASYWDTSTSGRATSALGTGYATADLQAPTDYTAGSIYADWNANLDGQAGNDDPWNFGTAYQYPVLKYDGMNTAVQFAAQPVRYDTDSDGLIEVSSLAQLNAMRWDLNGDGAIDASASTSDTTAYNTAFPRRDLRSGSRMGCPSACTGYELMNNLDFNTDGSYPNWTGIGVASTGAATAFSAIFDGNDNTISNLSINSSTSTATGGGFIGLFGDVSGTIRDVGLLNVNITNTRTSTASSNNFGRTGALAGRLSSGGTVRGSYVAGGSVTHTTSSTSFGSLGCLLGYSEGTVRDSYATCNATGANNFTLSIGGLIGETQGTVDSTYATGTVTNTGSGAIAAGGLIGWSYGQVSVSYATGNVTGAGAGRLGGLIGVMEGPSFANYATGNVSGSGTGTGGTEGESHRMGGLIGQVEIGSGGYLRASYATGNVSGSGTGVKAGGLIGLVRSSAINSITAVYAIGAVSNTSTGTTATGGLAAEEVGAITSIIANSYWDTQTTGQDTTAGASSGTRGQTTSALQTPTGYTGIYTTWNQNLDGQAGNDDPWNFGAADQYPVLKYGGLDATAQFAMQLGIPTGVAVTANADTLVVRWRSVSGATGYAVQWKSGMQSYAASREAATTATLYKIPNLTPGTTYTIRVSATRAGARGTPSVEVMGVPEETRGAGQEPEPEPEPDPNTEPSFTEAVDPQSYWQDKAIDPLTLPAATDGDGDLTYSLTGLPEGLTFDAETRIVSGTPLDAVEKAIYTLTVTDEDGDEGTLSFFITIVANLLPSFGDASVDTLAYTRKQEIEAMTLPQVTGGDAPLTYALTPALPEGLNFNGETRELSGTPLEAIAETTYTLTATDSDGDAATLRFTLSVIADPMPTFGDTAVAARVYVQHREIDPLTLPQASSGDAPLTYALTPGLPEGLTFDAETRVLSGTPIKAMDETTYTLTATDGNGDEVPLMFTLEVPDLMPAFGDTTIAAQSYLVNQEIASLTLPQASGGDGMLVYILLPFLPDGLSFDPTTRTLSGMPTEAKAQATYTLSALDADGDVASLPFTLEVSLPSPDLNGDGNVNFADFLTFAGKFGSRLGQERYDARCDLNGDGQIDFDDFLIFAADFGSSG